MVPLQVRQAGVETLAPDASTLSILFAEDSRVTRHLVQLVLAKRGHEIDTVDDGERALHALGNRPYDLVLLDFHLPKLDGLQVAKQFKAAAASPHPHFVGVTADIEGLLAHPDNCEILDLVIGKPIDIVHLCNVVEEYERGKAGARPLDSSAEGSERRASRRMRITGGTATLILQSGERFPCRVQDLSLGGAALEVEARPAIGQLVIVGRTEGRVVRHTQSGIALEFTRAAAPARAL